MPGIFFSNLSLIKVKQSIVGLYKSKSKCTKLYFMLDIFLNQLDKNLITEEQLDLFSPDISKPVSYTHLTLPTSDLV